MLQGILQDRLSSALGASISFDKLSISPFRGSVDGRGLKASLEEGSPPFLTVDRVQLKVLLTALLQKKIEVETALIERPKLTILRTADGRWNLPIDALFRSSPPEPSPPTAPAAPAAPAAEESTKKSWAAVLDRLIVTDAAASYTDDTPGYDGYSLSVGPLNLELNRREGSDELTVLGGIEALRRTDRSAALGPIRISGVIRGIDALPDFNSLRGQVTVDLDQVVKIELDRLGDDLRATIALHTALAKLLELVPSFLQQLVPSWLASAQADLDLQATLGAGGLRLSTSPPK